MEHHDCSFGFTVSSQKNEQKIYFWNINTTHSGIRLGILNKHRRRYKKRVKGTLTDAHILAQLTKDMDVHPRDILRTHKALEGETSDYMTAWREKNKMTKAEMKEMTQSYQLIILYLNKLEQMNEGSCVTHKVDNDSRIYCVFFSPGYATQIIKFIRPVISLDCTHLKTYHKGGLYTFGVLDGQNDIVFLAFCL